MTPEEVFEQVGVDQLKELRQICCQGCSAKNGEGVWEGIGMLQETMENYDKNKGSQSAR